MHPVLAMAIGIVVMMGLIIFTKMHAFPSLIISAILIGVLALPFGDVTTLTQVVSTVTGGFIRSFIPEIEGVISTLHIIQNQIGIHSRERIVGVVPADKTGIQNQRAMLRILIFFRNIAFALRELRI